MFKFFKRKSKSNSEEHNKNIIDIQHVFKENLKYISLTELSAQCISNQFVKTQSRFWLTVGKADFPTGKVIIADPLSYLGTGEYSPKLIQNIPKGSYSVDVSIVRNEYVGIRMCTARLKIKDTLAVCYKLAKPTLESAAFSNGTEGLSGFPVDAGMMCICDAQVASEYQAFLNKWHEENDDKNHYDDYFAEFFASSEENLPAYQREGGDFIEWTNPNTKNRLVMIASGFGDGFYQSFWGYDQENTICELVVPMINPDLFEQI